MRAVWKFPLSLSSGPQNVTLPEGATIVHAHAQTIGGSPKPVMWAEVNPDAGTSERTFHVVATGEEFSVPFHRYVGTVHIDWTVWHVYEAPS